MMRLMQVGKYTASGFRTICPGTRPLLGCGISAHHFQNGSPVTLRDRKSKARVNVIMVPSPAAD
jgi:hypothetical protein